MLTMLQTAAYYLDIAKAEREAEAAVGRTLIFNGMTIADVAEYRERRLRHRELVAQREALGTVLELNASPGVEVEALPLLPVEEPGEREERETAIRIFAMGDSEPERDAYPDTYLVLLPPSGDGAVRDQPVALTLTREELGRLAQLARTALLDGSVLGALQASTEPMAAAVPVPVLAAPGAAPATEPANEPNDTNDTEEKAS